MSIVAPNLLSFCFLFPLGNLFHSPQICCLVIPDLLAGFSSGSGLFSMECLLSTSLGIPKSILSITISVLIPVLLILGSCVFWIINTCVKRADWQHMLQRCGASILVIVYLSWMDTWNRLFRFFHCTEVDRGGGSFAVADSRYWLEDTDVECFQKGHLHLAVGLGVPMFLGLTLVWGFMMGFLVLRARRHPNNLWNVSMFGFFYKGYRPERWYWEIVVMLRKLVLAGIVVVGYDDAEGSEDELAGFSAVVLLMLCLVAQVYAMPYDEPISDVNHLEALSLGASMMVFLSGLSFNLNEMSGIRRTSFSVLALCAISAALGAMLFKLVKVGRTSATNESRGRGLRSWLAWR